MTLKDIKEKIAEFKNTPTVCYLHLNEYKELVDSMSYTELREFIPGVGDRYIDGVRIERGDLQNPKIESTIYFK